MCGGRFTVIKMTIAATSCQGVYVRLELRQGKIIMTICLVVLHLRLELKQIIVALVTDIKILSFCLSSINLAEIWHVYVLCLQSTAWH